jgi:Xaa-Pro aminopeptidase
MDAGCEYFGYASDVTRTWPVDGRYTPEQRRVYETVLSVRQR